MSLQNDVLFFGCYQQAGHFLHAAGFRRMHVTAGTLPDSLRPSRIDAQFAPKDPQQRERRARLHHVDGWTVLAWWDRSVDRRPGSNSALLVQGTHAFEAVLDAGRTAFPELASRLDGLEVVS